MGVEIQTLQVGSEAYRPGVFSPVGLMGDDGNCSPLDGGVGCPVSPPRLANNNQPPELIWE